MTGGPWSVVLADDAPDLRMLIRTLLQRDGRFQVVGEAADGSEAIALARAHRPHAVILDLAMPVMDGFEALPTLRSEHPSTRILVLSGFSGAQVADRAVSLGADAYLEKGAAFTELTCRLAQLITGGREADHVP